MQRHLIPQVFLGILTVLSLGAIVLAVSETPDAASVAVHEATVATFGSPIGSQSVSVNLQSHVSAGQGSGTLTQILRVTFVAPDTMTVYRATAPTANLGPIPPGKIVGTLTGYAAVTGGDTPWTQHGSRYTRTESLAPFSQRVYARTALPGSVREVVTVSGGYLTQIHFDVTVRHQDSMVSQTYQFISIDGKPVAAITP